MLLNFPTEKEIEEKLLSYEDIETNAVKGPSNEKAWSSNNKLIYNDSDICFSVKTYNIGECKIPSIFACSASYSNHALQKLSLGKIPQKILQIERELKILDEVSKKHKIRLDYELWHEVGDKTSIINTETVGYEFPVESVIENIKKLTLDSQTGIILRTHKAIFDLDDVEEMYKAQKEFLQESFAADVLG